MERLDRALANSQWQDLFPCKGVEILSTCTSDHAPIYVWFQNKNVNRRSKHQFFRYEVAWKNVVDKGLMRKVWKAKERNQNGWSPVLHKLKKSKKTFLMWRKVNRDPSEKEIKETLEKVSSLQQEGIWN